jgi:hypothetical protein
MSRKSHAHQRPKHARRKRQRKSRWRSAATSDRLELYELAVQEPEAESDLVDQVWKDIRGRTPHHIREDFCGSAAVCADWVKRRSSNTAVGVDLDQRVLDWGMARIKKELKPSQLARLSLLKGDVRSATLPGNRKVDSVLAMNFSYFIFKQREDLKKYLAFTRTQLAREGLLLLDAYGGSDSFLEIEEDRNLDGFTYIWDQKLVNPITGHVVNHIHFEFPDGSKIKKAFTYDWRLWTIPELRDILLEVGFKDVIVYWEGTDKKTGEGNGVWKPSTRGEACAGWIAYIVAVK